MLILNYVSSVVPLLELSSWGNEGLLRGHRIPQLFGALDDGPALLFEDFLKSQIQSGKTNWNSKSELIRAAKIKVHGQSNRILKKFEKDLKAQIETGDDDSRAAAQAELASSSFIFDHEHFNSRHMLPINMIMNTFDYQLNQF